MNTWPGGKMHAMEQDEHERWNDRHYPGTLQLCIDCDEPTDRCEEDAIYIDDEDGYGPLCEECYSVHKNNIALMETNNAIPQT